MKVPLFLLGFTLASSEFTLGRIGRNTKITRRILRTCCANSPRVVSSTTAPPLVREIQIPVPLARGNIDIPEPPTRENKEIPVPLARESKEATLAFNEIDPYAVLPPLEERPGTLDANYFRLDESSRFWKSYDAESSGNFLTAMKEVQNSIKGPKDAAYWGYNLLRFLYFSGNALLGLYYSELTAAAPKGYPQTLLKSPGVTPGILGDVVDVHLWNLKWIHKGLFKMPYDMNLNHRQYDPGHVFPLVIESFKEMASRSEKLTAGAIETVWMAKSTKLYPKYYLHDFHFQTDGWMSTRSAEIYNYVTEITLAGKQDAMQRSALVPFAKFMTKFRFKTPKVLEIAAGTGRFATFLKDSFPEVNLIVSDLSPFYLEAARKNINYWKKAFHANQEGTFKIAQDVGTTRFLHCAAEDIPLPDSSQDCVIAMNLFHELPAETRRGVIKEVARVLKPGGTFILTDSIQLGDRIAMDETIGLLTNYNEPEYPTYIREDFGKLMTEEGLFKPEEKVVLSVTKTLSFTRL
eukprot:CAMPEP_0184491294 /NCGR_PEP_ID=MMETSP0113_2-20130426/20062_1 /TAXON_ID=91329 /ORGANISM="Norrisiella sphaerica, Strain BC52" /LENGTH=519 /DNA_ID=CAMNT_0026875593 /DNA_START=304 /DNA_END=1863 /DNA_ORIENTATION=-